MKKMRLITSAFHRERPRIDFFSITVLRRNFFHRFLDLRPLVSRARRRQISATQTNQCVVLCHSSERKLIQTVNINYSEEWALQSSANLILDLDCCRKEGMTQDRATVLAEGSSKIRFSNEVSIQLQYCQQQSQQG